MKLKPTFITNSSSSNFIVAWPYKIKKIEDVLPFIPNYQKAQIVFYDSIEQSGKKIKLSKKLIKEMVEKLKGGIIDFDHLNHEERKDAFLKRNNITDKEYRKNSTWQTLFWDENVRKKVERYKEKAVAFIKANEGSYYYIYRYADEDGEFYSELEHGGTFNNLNHIRIVNH